MAAPSAGSTIATRPFLDDKKEVAPGQAWSREVTSQSGGTIAFRVESQGPFSVSVITETGFKAIQGGAGPTMEDLLLTADSKGATHDGRVALRPGSSWFVIENRAGRQVEIRLICSPAK